MNGTINTSTNSIHWKEVRSQFNLNGAYIHLAQMLLASHPKQVREAIELHRNKLDDNPTEYYEKNYVAFETRARKAAADYMKADPEEVVLTDSTTMGLGLLFTGLKLKKGEEILTTAHDHYSTEKAIEYAALKNGASVRRVQLYTDSYNVNEEELIEKLIKAIQVATRVVAITWVHSCTGVKLPVRQIAEALKKINEQRTAEDRIYLCVDGVHAFGVENVSMKELGCDFFVAGTHKWIFGPRGTGILWGKKEAWDMLIPSIPAFSDLSYYMWTGAIPAGKINFSDLHTPGGFHAFEHQWALNEAFEFQMNIGKAKVEERTHRLSTLLKQGLKDIKHIRLYTPIDKALSCGINCFDVEGMKAEEVVKKLHAKKIIASVTPYKAIYARLSPSIVNSEEEVRACVKALEEILS